MKVTFSTLHQHLLARIAYYSDIEIFNSLQVFDKSDIDEPYDEWKNIFELCYEHQTPHTVMFLRNFHIEPEQYNQWLKHFLKQKPQNTIGSLTLCFNHAELHDWLADSFNWTLVFDICSSRNLFLMPDKHQEYEQLFGIPPRSIEFLQTFIRAGLHDEPVIFHEWEEPFISLFTRLALRVRKNEDINPSNINDELYFILGHLDNPIESQECDILI